jgi:hypothetical protein
MTAAVNRIVKLLPSMFEASQVCKACKDASKCRLCIFDRHIGAGEKAALTAM